MLSQYKYYLSNMLFLVNHNKRNIYLNFCHQLLIHIMLRKSPPKGLRQFNYFHG